MICCGDAVKSFHERGVADLYRLLMDNPEFLKHAAIADKVVGKAAASLMILGDVREVYAKVISSPALALFHASCVSVSYDKVVPHIINRAQTGWCPLEQKCYSLSSPDDCFRAINDFISQK